MRNDAEERSSQPIYGGSLKSHSGCGMDGRELWVRFRAHSTATRLCQSVQNVYGTPSGPYSVGIGSPFETVKLQRNPTKHSPLSSATIKNSWTILFFLFFLFFPFPSFLFFLFFLSSPFLFFFIFFFLLFSFLFYFIFFSFLFGATALSGPGLPHSRGF